MTEKLLIIFQVMPDDTQFTGDNQTTTWAELKNHYSARIQAIEEKLISKGIRKVEIGSHGWFYGRGLTRGRFLTLSTMFLARLLKK